MRDYVVLCTSDLHNAANNWEDFFRNSRCQLLFANALDLAMTDLKRVRIDAIIVETPGQSLDEFELVHRLRQQVDHPILVVTASRNETYHLRGYQAGADECISSRVSKHLLQAKVSAWLRWTGQHQTKTGRVTCQDTANTPSHWGLDR